MGLRRKNGDDEYAWKGMTAIGCTAKVSEPERDSEVNGTTNKDLGLSKRDDENSKLNGICRDTGMHY